MSQPRIVQHVSLSGGQSSVWTCGLRLSNDRTFQHYSEPRMAHFGACPIGPIAKEFRLAWKEGRSSPHRLSVLAPSSSCGRLAFLGVPAECAVRDTYCNSHVPKEPPTVTSLPPGRLFFGPEWGAKKNAGNRVELPTRIYLPEIRLSEESLNRANGKWRH